MTSPFILGNDLQINTRFRKSTEGGCNLEFGDLVKNGSGKFGFTPFTDEGWARFQS